MSPESAVKPRKTPRQERSIQMNELILEAATRVLEESGPAAFTTNRVAERAGISVGSLYQYYPNKGALLFCLHRREAEATQAAIEAILRDASVPPRERAVRATEAFFESEAEERALRASLQLAQVFFYESAEFAEIQAGTRAAVRRFLAEALPRPVRDLDFKTDLFATVVAAVAEDVTTRALPRAQVRRFASETADMLCRQVGL